MIDLPIDPSKGPDQSVMSIRVGSATLTVVGMPTNDQLRRDLFQLQRYQQIFIEGLLRQPQRSRP